MTDTDYIDALRLMDHAAKLLQRHDVASQSEFLYEWRRLVAAFDALRVQIGQSPPELQRN